MVLLAKRLMKVGMVCETLDRELHFLRSTVSIVLRLVKHLIAVYLHTYGSAFRRRRVMLEHIFPGGLRILSCWYLYFGELLMQRNYCYKLDHLRKVEARWKCGRNLLPHYHMVCLQWDLLLGWTVFITFSLQLSCKHRLSLFYLYSEPSSGSRPRLIQFQRCSASLLHCVLFCARVYQEGR